MRSVSLRRAVVPLVAGGCLVLGAAGATTVSAQAPTPKPTAPVTVRTVADPGNPLAGRPWGVYKGRAEQSWQPYVDATGTTKTLLGRIALRPKAKWFGSWVSPSDIDNKVRDYIKNAQAGDPEALVQMTVFRLKPWEDEACKRLPTGKEQRDYKKWIDRFAAGVITALGLRLVLTAGRAGL